MFCFMYIGILAILFSFKKKDKAKHFQFKKRKIQIKKYILTFLTNFLNGH